MRFVKSFLGAWLAALMVFWGTMILAEPTAIDGQGLLTGLAFFPLYAFGFTLILGLPGWFFLRSNQFDQRWHFGIVGGAMGYLGLVLINPRFLVSLNRFTLGFVLAGTASGFVFRSLYGSSHDEFATASSP